MGNETSMTRIYYSISLLLMLISWILWGLAHHFILLGLGINASLALLIGAFAIAWLVGFFAFSYLLGWSQRRSVHIQSLIVFEWWNCRNRSILSRTLNVLIEIIAFVWLDNDVFRRTRRRVIKFLTGRSFELFSLARYVMFRQATRARRTEHQ